MQDRHLYRGRRLNNLEWVQGFYLHHYENDMDYILTGKTKNYGVDAAHPHLLVPGFEWIKVDPSTVGQCTGLLDGTGKPIFAGDILELYDYHGKRIVAVDYGEMIAAFYYGGDGFSDEYLFNSKDRTIIGNIHTTPELMEENDGTD